MHRLSRRSIAVLRTTGAARRTAPAPITPASPFNDSVGQNDAKLRWYSVLASGRSDAGRNSTQLNLRNGLLLGNRYESTAAASDASDPPAEKFEYQAEVSRLMDLIVHSLYSNKEVFLRELISNASDALDKLRFLSVTEPQLLKDGLDLDIRIQTDKDNGIIHLTDSGIGMTRQELVDCLGTIAQSGTAKFLKAVKESKDSGADSNLIGQFGVGFYSAFLVSDRVVVSTKSPKSDKQYVWEGKADASSYTIREETDPEKLIPRGTRLTLYLKRDDKDFAHPERVQKLVKNYSQFVSFPIYTWQEKGYTKEVEVEEDPAEAKKDEQDEKAEKKKKTKTVVERYWDWEQTNETQPIWLRNPKEVSTEEYNEFYKKAFNEYLDPLASSHFTTEGEVEFRSILYVPAIAPMGKEDIVNPKTKNIRLYVKRVFISDDFDGELFPRYLSFVKGVVDSNDLPLNVSREILQESRIVRIMKKRLVRKAFDMILGISLSENREDYEKFWENFGKHLKLGCIEDRENHKRLAPLLRFFSSQSENEMISLDEYVENMKPEQKDIYYIASDSVTSARNTPFLEKLLEKDLEVLFLVDPIDEVAITNLKSYKEKNFVDISKEDLDIGDKNEEKEKEMKQEFGQTCDWIKKRLGDKVASVQISNRLSTSPCVLVSGKFGWSANMERLMKAQAVGDTSSLDFMRGRRVFEINPEHPIIKNLNAAGEKTSSQDRIIGAHFFSPAHVMPLLEVVRTEKTSAQVILDLMTVGKAIKKIPVVVGSCTGFAVNRTFFPYAQGAHFLVNLGVDPFRIDWVISNFGLPMGPFQLQDLSGYGVAVAVGKEFATAFQGRTFESPLVNLLLKNGRNGKQNGKGYYIYEKGSKPRPDPSVLPIIEESRRLANIMPGGKPISVTNQEILEMILFPVVNEACRVLDEGVVVRASDLDITSVLGMSFPSYRGGIVFWADEVGPYYVYTCLKKWSAMYGSFFKPSSYLEQRATKGIPLSAPASASPASNSRL